MRRQLFYCRSTFLCQLPLKVDARNCGKHCIWCRQTAAEKRLSIRSIETLREQLGFKPYYRYKQSFRRHASEVQTETGHFREAGVWRDCKIQRLVQVGLRRSCKKHPHHGWAKHKGDVQVHDQREKRHQSPRTACSYPDCNQQGYRINWHARHLRSIRD